MSTATYQPADGLEEIFDLANAFATGRIAPDQIERLEERLNRSLADRQAFIEFMDLHAGLIRERGGAGVVRDLSRPAAKPAGRFATSLIAVTVAAVAAASIMVGFFFRPAPAGATAVASVASLSSDAVWEGERLGPGRMIDAGRTLKLVSGSASLVTAGGSLIDMIAPAACVFRTARDLALDTGGVAVEVPPVDHGFVVRTVDGVITDLGTRFLVERDASGTEVTVYEGRVRAVLTDLQKNELERFDLTAGRKVSLFAPLRFGKELVWNRDDDRREAEVASLRSGLVGTSDDVLVAVTSVRLFDEGDHPTKDGVLLIPERQGVALTEPLIVDGPAGPVEIEAGRRVDTYLIHSDPGDYTRRAPVGSVEFGGPVLGTIDDAETLARTDATLGREAARYPDAPYRGLEPGVDGDRIHISGDGRTLSFDLHLLHPHFLDQFRVVVASGGDAGPVVP